MATVTGMKELEATVKSIIANDIPKATRAALSKGARVIAKGQKQAVPPQYKEAKRLISSRYAKEKSGENKGQYVAKAGFGVGIKGKRRQKLLERAASRGKRPGVGLSVANIHWFAMGTAERVTKAGHHTGRMPAILGQVIEQGTRASTQEAVNKMAESMRESLAKVKAL